MKTPKKGQKSVHIDKGGVEGVRGAWSVLGVCLVGTWSVLEVCLGGAWRVAREDRTNGPGPHIHTI